MNGVNVQLDAEALAPLVRLIVEQTLAALEENRAALSGKLAYGELEAAALLSLAPHQLRDERLRGRLQASVGPGRKILYCRDDLLDYLRQRRWKGIGGDIT
jgi:hypothetical protein